MSAKNPTFRWLETEIDLRTVESAIDLRVAFARVLGIEDLERISYGQRYDSFWHECYLALVEQEKPYFGRRLIFLGWTRIESKFPKASKEIKTKLENFQQIHPHALDLVLR